MNTEFVPYEQAFDLNVLGAITQKRKHPSIPYRQAFRWFRDERNCHHYIEPIHRDGKVSYEYCVVSSSEDEKVFDEFSIAPTYEEAELKCLKILIEIAKQS